MKSARQYSANPALNKWEEDRFQRLMQLRVRNAQSSIPTARARKAARRAHAVPRADDVDSRLADVSPCVAIQEEVSKLEDLLLQQTPRSNAAELRKCLENVKALTESPQLKPPARPLPAPPGRGKAVIRTKPKQPTPPAQQATQLLRRKPVWDSSYSRAGEDAVVPNVRNHKQLSDHGAKKARGASKLPTKPADASTLHEQAVHGRTRPSNRFAACAKGASRAPGFAAGDVRRATKAAVRHTPRTLHDHFAHEAGTLSPEFVDSPAHSPSPEMGRPHQEEGPTGRYGIASPAAVQVARDQVVTASEAALWRGAFGSGLRSPDAGAQTFPIQPIESTTPLQHSRDLFTRISAEDGVALKASFEHILTAMSSSCTHEEGVREQQRAGSRPAFAQELVMRCEAADVAMTETAIDDDADVNLGATLGSQGGAAIRLATQHVLEALASSDVEPVMLASSKSTGTSSSRDSARMDISKPIFSQAGAAACDAATVPVASPRQSGLLCFVASDCLEERLSEDMHMHCNMQVDGAARKATPLVLDHQFKRPDLPSLIKADASLISSDQHSDDYDDSDVEVVPLDADALRAKFAAERSAAGCMEDDQRSEKMRRTTQETAASMFSSLGRMQSFMAAHRHVVSPQAIAVTQGLGSQPFDRLY